MMLYVHFIITAVIVLLGKYEAFISYRPSFVVVTKYNVVYDSFPNCCMFVNYSVLCCVVLLYRFIYQMV